MDLRPFPLLLAAMVLSCVAPDSLPAESSAESEGQGDSIEGLVTMGPQAAPNPGARSAPAARREVRVPYLGGAFVTYSGEMPIDVHQAIAGQKTDHPVIVWAGN
jgi:hypothetical protein